jgi:D-alanyl-lipoteichoic acid acyltransferase DltB (MBOAT superfamily)
LVIWRITRAWALCDGIESPENMNRCICNNYTFEGFWRSWHRSFNQWLIRYLFIPLGGSKFKSLNIWVVFSFVAIWHDFELNLIFWAWCICLSLIPEMIIRKYFQSKKVESFFKIKLKIKV